MNPNRHRPQNDFGRQDDARDWESRDRRYDEGRSWSEGDGGRTAEAWRGQGQYDRSQYDRGQYARDPYGRSDQDYGRHDRDHRPYRAASQTYGYDQGRSPGGHYGRDSHDYGASRDRASDYRGETFSRSDYDRPDHGRPHYGRSAYPDHGYAPGAQIWEGSGPGLHGERHADRSKHDFEPDYLHWREQQVSNFDRDYSDWRNERREKFSADFDNWRSSRPKIQADNPIVGDISEGGTGDASKIKNR
ncbi:hypothetical protein [Brevundimonas sp. GCM10030266]|uniref:hypothetical protein n=1 Tax=Brevundimonas sp. GCM10030266 TaxID=3273386 RepID=UPI00361944FA